MSEFNFASREALDSALAADIGDQLEDAIAMRGKAVLVVSGGSTPAGLFKSLSAIDLAWERVTVLLADDRWVPLAHADCNERMLREMLFVGHASAARLLSLVADYPDIEVNLQRVKQELASIGTFDVVVLGMGADAHTASLFPCAPELAEGLATLEDVLMTSPVTAPHRRITLSRQRIANTHCGVLHIVGYDKRNVLHNALTENKPELYPIMNFIELDDLFSVYWAA